MRRRPSHDDRQFSGFSSRLVDQGQEASGVLAYLGRKNIRHGAPYADTARCLLAQMRNAALLAMRSLSGAKRTLPKPHGEQAQCNEYAPLDISPADGATSRRRRRSRPASPKSSFTTTASPPT